VVVSSWQLAAQRIDARLERVVEHVADHRHPARIHCPTAELGDGELGHGAAAGVHGKKHGQHRLAESP